ncbi:MAG: hypothetical protein Q4A79_03415 [Candidatus Saccharibacteria bacterium]|nr:hypothetical protein [Candidatus Saccharibacteria bacterium]
MTARKTHSRNLAKPIILIIIVLSALVIIIALAASYFLRPELRVKNLISELSSEYYEDYFYDKYISNVDNTELIEKKTKNGLSPIPLHQLLLYDNQKNEEHLDFLSTYCDLDTTFITIHPDPPYDKKSYHTEYSYSCNF